MRSPKQRLEEQYLRLDSLTEKLVSNQKNNIVKKKASLKIAMLSVLSRSPEAKIVQERNEIKKRVKLLMGAIQKLIFFKHSKLEIIVEKLQALNPSQILNRGYSITFDGSGKIISNAKDVKFDDVIYTRLQNAMLNLVID